MHRHPSSFRIALRRAAARSTGARTIAPATHVAATATARSPCNNPDTVQIAKARRIEI
jgi:hypothetical protein